jgi:hypothetical protein
MATPDMPPIARPTCDHFFVDTTKTQGRSGLDKVVDANHQRVLDGGGIITTLAQFCVLASMI